MAMGCGTRISCSHVAWFMIVSDLRKVFAVHDTVCVNVRRYVDFECLVGDLPEDRERTDELGFELARRSSAALRCLEGA